MTDFLKLLKIAGNDYAAVVSDGIAAGDVAGYIDTGSYAFNALCSGSVFGGIASNKVTALAGEPSTGKTFYALSIVRAFQRSHPDNFVYYFESESAISKKMMEDRGIDVKRVAILPVATIQEFRTQCLRLLDAYLEIKKEDRKPIMLVLDSLGNLSTNKEMEDIAAGKDTRDMTRAQLVRGAFRTITLKMGIANVPMIVTNHVYAVVGSYVPTKRQGGGDGLPYAASQIIFLSKKKDREDGEVTGVLITAKLEKSRLTKENQSVETLLRYDTGLDRFGGLLELAEEAEIVKKVSTKYEFPDGSKVFEKHIKAHGAKYWTQELLERIDGYCKENFLYGVGEAPPEEENE
jgi:RecA/RadA recombinase